MEYHVEMVPIGKIRPDPNQPRKIFDAEGINDLAESIKRQGVIKNIEIDENFIIISGENRWRAAKRAGLKEIPCRILKLNKIDRSERQLHENIHRIEMNPMDVAEALKGMLDNNKGMTQKELATMYGKSTQWVQNYIHFLAFPEELKTEARKGQIPAQTLNNVAPIVNLEKEGVLKKGSTVRVIEKLKKEQVSKHGTRFFAAAITTDPNGFEKYMAVPLKGLGPDEIRMEMDSIQPSLLTNVRVGNNIQDQFLKLVLRMSRYFNLYPYERLGLRRSNIREEVVELRKTLDKWLRESTT